VIPTSFSSVLWTNNAKFHIVKDNTQCCFLGEERIVQCCNSGKRPRDVIKKTKRGREGLLDGFFFTNPGFPVTVILYTAFSISRRELLSTLACSQVHVRNKGKEKKKAHTHGPHEAGGGASKTQPNHPPGRAAHVLRLRRVTGRASCAPPRSSIDKPDAPSFPPLANPTPQYNKLRPATHPSPANPFLPRAPTRAACTLAAAAASPARTPWLPSPDPPSPSRCPSRYGAGSPLASSDLWDNPCTSTSRGFSSGGAGIPMVAWGCGFPG